MNYPTKHLLEAIARLNRVQSEALAIRSVRNVVGDGRYNSAVELVAANDPDGASTEVLYNRRDLREINRLYISRRIYGLTGPSLLDALLERLQTAYHLTTLDAGEVELVRVQQPQPHSPQYWKATLRALPGARLWQGETEIWMEYDPEAHLSDLEDVIETRTLSGLSYVF